MGHIIIQRGVEKIAMLCKKSLWLVITMAMKV
jgi:hypothetical protein